MCVCDNILFHLLLGLSLILPRLLTCRVSLLRAGRDGPLITCDDLTNPDCHLRPHSVRVALQLPTFPLSSIGFIVYGEGEARGAKGLAVNTVQFSLALSEAALYFGKKTSIYHDPSSSSHSR